MVGADPEELEGLAVAFDHAATEITRIEWVGSSRLFLAGWVGADVDDVRLRWNTGCRPGMRAAAESIRQAATHLRQEAEQQRRASDAGNGPWIDLKAILWGLSAGAFIGGAVQEIAKAARAGENSLRDTVGDALRQGLLTAYDIGVRMPVLGEILEGTASATPVQSVLTRTPTTLEASTIYDNMAKVYERQGQIEVQTVLGADGQERYVVYIPGTQQWLPGSNNPADVMSDIEVGTSYDDSVLSHAVAQAMQNAGIPEGAQVVLAGHSLGGLTAVQMSRDPAISSQYDIAGVFTAGAGTDITPPPMGVQFQALRHHNDVVSYLGVSNQASSLWPGQQEHWSMGPVTGFSSSHDISGYQVDAKNLQVSGAFAGAEQALPGFFGPGAVVVQSQGFQAEKLSILGSAESGRKQ
jgi:hypothetical protein